MIHGHTHRPAVHSLEVDGSRVRRIVLGDWHTQGSVLEGAATGFELRSLPRAERTGVCGGEMEGSP